MNTDGPCTDPTTTQAQVYLYGSGFPDTGYGLTASNPIGIIPQNPDGGYNIGFEDNLAAAAAAQTPPATFSGTYTFAFVCKAGSFTDVGDYATTITFTDPNHYVSGVVAAPTTTTLSASPASSAVVGAPVTLTASITPAGATGSVQFLDGTTVLGTSAVTNDQAALTTAALAVGPHSVTAVFTPVTPAGATPSTSAAVTYTIAAAPTPPVVAPVAVPVVVDPTALVLEVGTKVTCPDGSVLQLAPADIGSGLVCHSGGADISVVTADPLYALVAPSLSGSGRTGTKLVLTPGVWAPAATSKTIVWKRDGKVIVHATGLSYLLGKADKGHKITAEVIAHRPGYGDGVQSTSPFTAKGLSAAAATPVVRNFAATAGVPGDASPLGLPVGSFVGCVAARTTGATTSAASWLLDGAAYSAHAVIPVADALFGHVLTCRTTATNAGGSTVSDAVIKVGLGSPLNNFVKPRVLGKDKVGSKLSVATGRWNPTYSSVSFVWLRDGKPIRGATKATYVPAKTDKKHKISVRVTAVRAAWTTATAVSAAVSIG